MRISDWSSDVCSSDLLVLRVHTSGITLFWTVEIKKDSSFMIGCEDTLVCVMGVKMERGSGICNRFTGKRGRSEEHTCELQSLMRTSYAAICLQTTVVPTVSRPRFQPNVNTVITVKKSNPTT